MTWIKKIGLATALLGLCLSQTGSTAAKKPWKLDAAHSSMRFTTKHLMLDKVDGYFKLFSANLKVDEQGRLWSGVGTVKTNSVSTGNDERDEILRGKNLFDVKKHPNMTFRANKVTYTGNVMTVLGTLHIKNTTKPIKLTGKFNGLQRADLGNGPMDHASYVLNGSVKRKDYGLDFEGALNSPNVVAARIDIILELAVIRAL